MSEELQRTLSLEGLSLVDLFGEQDCHLRSLEERFGVLLVPRNGQLLIRGPLPSITGVMPLLEHLCERVRGGEVITAEEELGGIGEPEEEFEIPYGAPVALEPEVPVGALTVLFLVATIMVMAWAALLVSENVLGTSSALTSWSVGAP